MTHDTGTKDFWRPEGLLTIEQAAAANADAAAALARGIARVDLAAVERIDTAGCQILLKMAHEARGQGLGWEMTGVSPTVLDTLRRLGCDAPLSSDDTATQGHPL